MKACMTACLEIAQYCSSLSDIKGRHTNSLTHTQALVCPPLSVFQKKKNNKRMESGLKWKLEGPRESQSETHINIHTHMEESAVSWMDLCWGGVYCPCALSLKWGTGHMYRPQRGACLHPPHRLAEGSGPSGAHNTKKEWGFLTKLLSLHTLSSPTLELFCWEQACLGQWNSPHFIQCL